MKSVYATTLGLMLIAGLFLGCLTVNKQSKAQVAQGIQGQVFEQKGNSMPQKDKPMSNGVGFPPGLGGRGLHRGPRGGGGIVNGRRRHRGRPHRPMDRRGRP